MVSTDYYDSFGRKVQTVLHNASPDGGDIADLTEYDARGKISRSWLPMTCGTGGEFKTHDTFETQDNAQDRHTDFTYENSSLSRLMAVTGANSTGHVSSIREWYGSGDVLCFKPISNGVVCQGEFSSMLKHIAIVDEDGCRSVTIYSPFGEKLLERRFAGTDTLDTYYVYDARQRLCAVLPPMASFAMKHSGNYTVSEGNALDKYAFMYKYDARGNCIEKKLPGTGWQSFVYDADGRVLFSQTSEQLARNEWTFFRYDDLSRLVMKGTMYSIYEREALQSEYGNMVQTFSYSGYGDYGYGGTLNGTEKADIVFYYDGYAYRQLSIAASLTTATPEETYARGRLTGKYVRALGTDMGEISCYTYDYRGRCIKELSYNAVSGLLHTEDRTFIHDNLLTNYVKYHYIGNKFLKENRVLTYDAGNRLKNDRNVISDQTGSTNTMTPVIKNYSYDNINRLISVSLSNIEKQEYAYDTRGRLASVAGYCLNDTLGTTSSDAFVQNLVYDNRSNNLGKTYRGGRISEIAETYNLDDWTYGIQYDSSGRITKTKSAENNRQPATWPNLIVNSTYQEEIGYEKNGNISSLKRSCQNPMETYNILLFSYDGNHLSSSTDSRIPGVNNNIENQIVNSPLYYKPCSEDNPYLYDLDGNETRNLSQSMAYTHYNNLNLPDSVVFTSGNTLLFTYMADGRRIKTVAKTYGTPLEVPGDGSTMQGDPINVYEEIMDRGLVFKDSVLTELRFDGGYVTLVDEATGQRQIHRYYYRTDYRGDVRQVVDGMTGAVLQDIKYLPTGAVFSITNAALQSYRFGGKEEMSLHGWGMYDSMARLQYKNLPRFAQADPLAELDYGTSPYAFCMNDFVNFVDPWGLFGSKDEADAVANRWGTGYCSIQIDDEWYVIHDVEAATVSQYSYTQNAFTQYFNYHTYDPFVQNGGYTYWSNVLSGYGGGGGSNASIHYKHEGAGYRMAYDIGTNILNYRAATQYSDKLNIWRGQNGKIYNGLTGKGPNQYTGSRNMAKVKAARMNFVGKTLFGASEFYGVNQAIKNIRKDNYGRAIVNGGVVVIGIATIPASAPVALTVGIIVGIADAIWGDDLGDYLQEKYFEE